MPLSQRNSINGNKWLPSSEDGINRQGAFVLEKIFTDYACDNNHHLSNGQLLGIGNGSMTLNNENWNEEALH
eukprot:5733380-Amphidinium_carterae.2